MKRNFLNSQHKHLGIWPCYLILFLLSSCLTNSDKTIKWDPDKANTLEELQRGFRTPPIDFSTAPFWVWNDVITKEKIEFQLKEFKDKGIHMAFIHPRPGLVTEYLSTEWFELVKYSVDKAKELDMLIWLYDENSYPSGFAGGHVPAATFSASDPIAGLKLNRLEVLSESDTNNYFLIIKQVGNSFANITNSAKKYYNQPGKYYAYTKWYFETGRGWHGGFSYVDLLAYGITEKFIKLTMDGYEDYIGEEFGKSVPGIFTDEPNINAGARNVIRYTPVLLNRFERKYGYQLETYLPCLYDEIGDWKNVRYDYYALLLEMFIERWSLPWNKYTEEKGLNWTGHYWEHGWPDPKHGGDNMAMYAFHQYPGIDMLFNTDKRPDQFGNIRAVKELSSVVNQLDKSRALSETYGGAGWELSFEDMKRLGDWEYALGVNLLNQHLSHMTLKGARKRDYPQSMSYHTPWWDNYKPLNEYFHRLSFAMTAGKQVNRILILEPTTTGWMLNPAVRGERDGESIQAIDQLKDTFHDLLTKLEQSQVEYDLGCESIIGDHGSVEGNKFVVGSRRYDLVVLPPMFENFMDSTYKLLLNYLQGGGRVLSLAGMPERIDGNVSKSIGTEFEKYADQWVRVESIDQKIIEELFSEYDFKANNPESWGGNVFHHRRILKDGQLYFFTNYDKNANARIAFTGKGESVVEFDLMTGEFHLLDVTEKEGYIDIEFSLSPSGSKLLFFSENSESGDTKSVHKDALGQLVKTSETIIKRLESNTLTLDYCDLEVGDKSYKDLYFYNAADTIYKEYMKDIYGYNYNPWSNAVQYRTRIMDKNEFDSTTGFEVKYHFWVENGFLPATINAVVEWPQFYKVKINGKNIDPIPGEWWLDKSFGVFDLRQHISDNQMNTISLSAHPMDVLAEVEPVYLVGDFSIASSPTKGFHLSKEKSLSFGSWQEQGMPFYSHDVSYSKTFENPSIGKMNVRLNDWNGTVAEVRVNGESAGIIAWKPYELNISDQLNDGENKVEVVVTGSLKNLMGPHHLNPERGFVTPWSFFRAPAHQPPGEEYDMIDYGLFEDFEIVAY